MLVAPAIVALWAGPPKGAQGDAVAEGLAVVEEVVSAQDAPAELEVDSEGSRSDSEGSISDALSQSTSEPPVSGCTEDSEGYAAQAGEPLDGSEAAAGGAAAVEAAAAVGGAVHAGSHSRRKHRSHVRQRGPRLLRVMAAVAQAAALQVVRAVVRLAGPLLVLLLRRLVRSRRCVAGWWIGCGLGSEPGCRLVSCREGALPCLQATSQPRPLLLLATAQCLLPPPAGAPSLLCACRRILAARGASLTQTFLHTITPPPPAPT